MRFCVDVDGGSGILDFVFPSRILCASFNMAVVSSLLLLKFEYMCSDESEESEIIPPSMFDKSCIVVLRFGMMFEIDGVNPLINDMHGLKSYNNIT